MKGTLQTNCSIITCSITVKVNSASKMLLGAEALLGSPALSSPFWRLVMLLWMQELLRGPDLLLLLHHVLQPTNQQQKSSLSPLLRCFGHFCVVHVTCLEIQYYKLTL